MSDDDCDGCRQARFMLAAAILSKRNKRLTITREAIAQVDPQSMSIVLIENPAGERWYEVREKAVEVV
jgi:hypothetical protein